MMKLMNKKLTKKGFTLAELLIVVAILAILVAVSIPIFTSKLHDSQDATDMANARAAKGAAVAQYLTDGLTTDAVYYYDATNGVVYKDDGTNTEAKKITGYSQCKKTCSNRKGAGKDNAIVKVTITGTSGAAVTTWVTATTLAE